MERVGNLADWLAIRNTRTILAVMSIRNTRIPRTIRIIGITRTSRIRTSARIS